jgi:hypothetical protein
MNRGGVRVYELERARDVVQAPFGRLLSEALSLDVPAQWSQSLGRDIDVGFRLSKLSVGVSGQVGLQVPLLCRGPSRRQDVGESAAFEAHYGQEVVETCWR